MAPETPRSARRAELAAFLRAQRARLRPADAGLPPDGNPATGVIELEMFQLRPVEHPDMLLVLQVPRDDEARQRLTALLDGPG